MYRIEHNEKNWIFPFVEYSSKKYTEKLPLVIQLHGAGERGSGKSDLSRVDTHGFSKLVASTDYECLFIMPQCPSDTFWAARVESILKFIEQITDSYNVDKNRIYLTGLSMGGYGTWFTAMAKPDIFAAIAPVCGGGMPWNAHVLKMPIWTFHGSEDNIVSKIQTDQMVEALKKTDADVTYTILEGVGHNAWDYAYNENLISWLLSKKK